MTIASFRKYQPHRDVCVCCFKGQLHWIHRNPGSVYGDLVRLRLKFTICHIPSGDVFDSNSLGLNDRFSLRFELANKFLLPLFIQGFLSGRLTKYELLKFEISHCGLRFPSYATDRKKGVERFVDRNAFSLNNKNIWLFVIKCWSHRKTSK